MSDMDTQAIIIAKFGGTSVSAAENIHTIGQIVEKEKKEQHAIVVVVSALSGITDLLLGSAGLSAQIRHRHQDLVWKLWQNKQKREQIMGFIDKQLENANRLLSKKEKDKKLLDQIVSYGEIMSSYIVSNWLSECGMSSQQIIASEIIVTDSNFGSAEFLLNQTEKKAQKIISPLLKKGIVPVVTGFIGANEKGEITTLGRGGSDYSASILGLCLKASEVQIWTDVNGIFTADPRLVPSARPIKRVSYQEASEMAFFGAKVLHPRTIRPAVKAGIPVLVLNTFNPRHKGTLITNKTEKSGRVTALSFKKKVTLVTILAAEMFLAKGFLTRIFTLFTKQGISVDLVSASEVSISLTVDTNDLRNIIAAIGVFAKVTVIYDAAMVSLIGDGIGNTPHVLRDMFTILDKEEIEIKMISFGATNSNISCIISEKDFTKAVMRLHNDLLLRRIK